MGLKQHIVVKNEYTIKNGKNSKGGSRGGTPGEYVLRYMSRYKATEGLTPIQFDDEPYVQRYAVRKDIVDNGDSVEQIKADMKQSQGLGGLAFGYGDISLSHNKLKTCSKDIQAQFDKGKTVLKTILSFDEAYLRKHKIVDEDFVFNGAGSYRGNIDQMKLRMAITNGINKMAVDYDDLQFVGCIQVDTAHVHCHLAMVDRGVGILTKDGTQKGKLSEQSKRKLRRGIDMFLDEKQSVRILTSNVNMDKRNTICFVKKFTHETMYEHGLPQFLISCLPKDRRLWRADTNRLNMRKANAIVRGFVNSVLAESNSGYSKALRDINDYAQYRLQNESLSDKEYRKLITDGQNKIISDCMNSVYSVLKKIPDDQLRIKTPTLDMMSMDYESMAAKQQSDPMVEFGFKLRSYSNRLQHHKNERRKYHEAVQTYEKASVVSPESKAMYDFFKAEEEYNAMLLAKYQHFLMFMPASDEYEDDFNELMEYKHKIRKHKDMLADKSFKKMSSTNAEQYGKDVYGLSGGRYMTFAPHIIENRILIMESEYANKEADFKYKLSEYGLSMNDKGVFKHVAYDFEDVKALDLHHLAYDFPNDFKIDSKCVDKFVAMSDKRYMLYKNAKDYLIKSNQTHSLDILPERDIKAMRDKANSIRNNAIMRVVKPVVNNYNRNSITIPLDIDYAYDMRNAILQTLE